MKNTGQTIVEYSLVLGIIVTVMIAMQPLIKRTGQGLVRTVADQVGVQNQADQRAFYENSTSDSHLEFATSKIQTQADLETVEFLGLTNFIQDDQTISVLEQQSNLGFTEDRNP